MNIDSFSKQEYEKCHILSVYKDFSFGNKLANVGVLEEVSCVWSLVKARFQAGLTSETR